MSNDQVACFVMTWNLDLSMILFLF